MFPRYLTFTPGGTCLFHSHRNSLGSIQCTTEMPLWSTYHVELNVCLNKSVFTLFKFCSHKHLPRQLPRLPQRGYGPGSETEVVLKPRELVLVRNVLPLPSDVRGEMTGAWARLGPQKILVNNEKSQETRFAAGMQIFFRIFQNVIFNLRF